MLVMGYIYVWMHLQLLMFAEIVMDAFTVVIKKVEGKWELKLQRMSS